MDTPLVMCFFSLDEEMVDGLVERHF